MDSAVGRNAKGSSQMKREAEATRAAAVASERELNPYWKDGGDGMVPEDGQGRAGTITTSPPPT